MSNSTFTEERPKGFWQERYEELQEKYDQLLKSKDAPDDNEYIRKDLVDEMIKTAEDHAFFAGQEKLRERLLELAKEKANDYKGTANIGRSFELMIKKIVSL